MYNLNIIHILRGAVPCVPHVPDHIPRRDNTSLRQPLRIRIVLAQMGVIIIPLAVKTADADTPASILIPAQRFHNTGFHSHNRCAHQSHHVMPKVLPLISITAAHAEIIIMRIIKALCQRKIALQPITFLKTAIFVFYPVLTHQTADGSIVGFLIISIIFQILCQLLQILFSFGEGLRGFFHKLQRTFVKGSPCFCRRVGQQIHPTDLMLRAMGFDIPIIGAAQRIVGHGKVHPLYVIIFHSQHGSIGRPAFFYTILPGYKTNCRQHHQYTLRKNSFFNLNQISGSPFLIHRFSGLLFSLEIYEKRG
ncbi:hypothetical protein IMSAG185_00527 [Lachnospiraceae bacterium]|nr:hypothetical protein IMSAG185_00527 [Lachnospiraceae bacterium]